MNKKSYTLTLNINPDVIRLDIPGKSITYSRSDLPSLIANITIDCLKADGMLCDQILREIREEPRKAAE